MAGGPPATGLMASFSPPMAPAAPPGAMTSFSAPMAPPMAPMMTAGNPAPASMPPMMPSAGAMTPRADPMMSSSMPSMMAPPMTTPNPMASGYGMPPGTTPLDPMASMPMAPPRTTPLADPYASAPAPMMRPGTTPLVDPAGPLPSDIFQSAAAVPTQHYSVGTFPSSGAAPPDGFASAASMTTPAGGYPKPSLWESTGPSKGAGTGVMQSAPAPAVSPTVPATNPFMTAGPASAGAPSPFDVPATGILGVSAPAPPPPEASVTDTVGNGDVTLRVSRILDIPKESATSGSYYVEISTKDGKKKEIGPFDASPTGEITEDVDVPSGDGDMTVTTKSPEIIVTVKRAGRMYGKTVIGEASIHRLDPRSRAVCAYAMSSKATPHPGGIELYVLERPPGKAAAHEPEGLLPMQHHVMAILDIEKLVMLPPPSGMTGKDQVQIKIEPLDKMAAAEKKRLTTYLPDPEKVPAGYYSTKPDPTKSSLRMCDVRERLEYKGVFRADRGGLMRLRISVWYQGMFGAGEEIGGADVDVTFAVSPVNTVLITKKDDKDGKGSMYLGCKLVEETEWRHGAGKLEGSELTEFDPHSSASALKSGSRPKVKMGGDDLFPAPVSDGEKEQIKKLEEQLKQLSLENEHTKITIGKMKSGAYKPSKFDEAMRALGPPHLNPEVPLAPGLTAALFPVKVPKTQHVDESGHLSTEVQVDNVGHLQSTSIYEVETAAFKPTLAPGNMVDPASLPDMSLRFQDVNPQYTVSDDVWGLAQKNLHAASHASNIHNKHDDHHRREKHKHQQVYRNPKVREDCILT